MKSRSEVLGMLATDGVLLRREHPQLHDATDRLVACGVIRAVLPGVYAAAGQANDPRILVAAICRDDPDAVVTGQAAAWLSYWPDCRPPERISVAVACRRRPRAGYLFQQRGIPAELILRRGPVRITAPALTALDLSTLDHSEPIDVALRSRTVTVDQLRRALELSPHRPGNRERWMLVVESLTNPWSFAERRAQRLFRAENIVGWVANRPVHTHDGSLYYVDLAFDDARLGVEVDGRAHHGPAAFESDRRRGNALAVAGWLVLHVTVQMIDSNPELVADTVRAALRLRRSEIRARGRRAAFGMPVDQIRPRNRLD